MVKVLNLSDDIKDSTRSSDSQNKSFNDLNNVLMKVLSS